MAEISHLSYVCLEVSDLAAWKTFAVDILGMQPGAPGDARSLNLRMDGYAYRFSLTQGPADDIVAAGWELESAADLDAYVARVRSAGGDMRPAPEALTRLRGVQALYLLEDPTGFTHEFFVGPTKAATPFASKVLTGPGFRTGDLGIGHILPVAKDYAASKHFYTEIMGLRLSDVIREEVAPGVVADATFFHSKTGRHHSLATGQFPWPKRLNHFMVEVLDMDDVGLAYERALKADIPIIMHLGHHPNDKVFSFYMKSPSGFGVEVGFGGVVIDDPDWKPVIYSKMSDWGHKRVAPLPFKATAPEPA